MATTLTTNSTTAQQTWDIRTLDRMSYYLRYNVEIFIQLYSYFVQNNIQAIVNYYTSSANSPDKESFDFLADLITEITKIKALITLNKTSFTQADDWELLDFLEGINTKLQTVDNTDKWTRSSKTQNAWQGAVIQTDYTLQDGETLEDLSELVYGGTTNQDDWMRIALENDLREGDYTPDSNALIKLTKQVSSSPNVFLNSIVDNLINQALYGLDFSKKIAFVNNDLQVLNYNDTFVQAVQILISVKKGDNPEFGSLGMDPKLAVGASYGSLKFSSIIRQLQNVFATDDSLRNFSVTGISYTNGALYITYQVDSFYHLTYGGTNTIQQQ